MAKILPGGPTADWHISGKILAKILACFGQGFGQVSCGELFAQVSQAVGDFIAYGSILLRSPITHIKASTHGLLIRIAFCMTTVDMSTSLRACCEHVFPALP